MKKCFAPICGRQNTCSLYSPSHPHIFSVQLALPYWKTQGWSACLIFLDGGCDSDYNRNAKVWLFSACISSERLSLIAKHSSEWKVKLTQYNTARFLCRETGVSSQHRTAPGRWTNENSEDSHIQALSLSMEIPHTMENRPPFSCAVWFLTHRFCEESKTNLIFRDIGQ